MNNDTTYLAAINVVLTALENKVAADYNAAIAVAGADLAALDAAKSAATEAFAAYRESFALKLDAQARIDALDDAIASLGSAFASTAEYLPTAIDIITDNENNLAAVRLAIAAYNAEIKSLDEVKKDSEGFIEYMKSYNPDSRDYTYILDAYAQISQFELRDNSYNYANNDPDCVYYYIPLLGALEEKIEEMNSIIGKFKESVLIMQDTSRDFDTRFNVGYLSAKEVYNGGKIYDGVDVNTVPELSSFIESYLIIEESFSTTINASENFVATVDSAMFNTLYETKKAALAVAKELLANDVNINVAYPGVADAIAKITTVENDIKALEEAASAYISAVAEIATKTTFKDKSAAIEKAQKLQAAGNVVGISGVSEANGALANYSAEIQILEGNSKTFVESVSRLDEEELTLAERRELIIIADSVKIGAEPTYDGVAEALESLAAHKEAYKTEVELINSAFASEVANVTTVAGASANQSRYYSVMELIKLLVASFK